MSPVQSWGHVQYWEVSSTVTTTVTQVGGYPTWQQAPLSLVLGSMFGGLEPYYERLMRLIRWVVRIVRVAVRWSPEQRDMLDAAVKAIDHPLFPHAVRGVKMTAVLPGFNEPQAWKQLGGKLAQHPGWAENTWRHLHASYEFERMIRAEGSTVTNGDRALLVELAYHHFARHAVGSSHA